MRLGITKFLLILLSIDLLGSLSPAYSQTTTLDVAGAWTGTTQYTVTFDYYPAPVRCEYEGRMTLPLLQTNNTVTGSADVVITNSNLSDLGACTGYTYKVGDGFSSFGEGAVVGSLFGSAFTGAIGGTPLKGSFTSDTFVGNFSGFEPFSTVAVAGGFTLNKLGFQPTPPPITGPAPPRTGLLGVANILILLL